LRYEVFLAVNI